MKPTENRTAVILRFIHRYFIWMIVSSYIAAAMMPRFGLWIHNFSFGGADSIRRNRIFSLPLLMLAVLLFNAGLGAKAEELIRLVQKPLVLLGGLICNLTIPLAFIVAVSSLKHIWHDQEEIQQILVGLALVASMPIAGSSAAWSQNSNGSLALSLGLILSTTALSPLLAPFVLDMAGFVTTGDLSKHLRKLASGEAASFLGTWVILPTLFGILAHLLIGETHVTRVMPYLKIINFSVLLFLNYSNASLTLPNLVSHPDIDFLAVMLVIVIALCVSAFSAGYLLARLSRVSKSERVSLVFGLGMNNNGAGLVLASVALAHHPQVMLPIIFYNLAQQVIAAAVDLALFKS